MNKYYSFFAIIILIFFSCNELVEGHLEDDIGGFKLIKAERSSGTIELDVLCIMYNSCGRFGYLNYSIDDTIITVRFYPIYIGEVCAQVITSEEHSILINNLPAATYIIKHSPDHYYDISQSADWKETLIVELN